MTQITQITKVTNLQYHRGALNVKSAINWLTEKKTTLTEKILITGCSAGAYASLYWTPAIREIFPYKNIPIWR